jgi:hypothetical protein
MDEIPSKPADFERRTLSKACLTSEGRKRYSVEERGALQKVVEESRADLCNGSSGRLVGKKSELKAERISFGSVTETSSIRSSVG